MASSSRGKIPQKSSSARSQMSARSSASSRAQAPPQYSVSSKGGAIKKQSSATEIKEKKEFQLPAFSIPYRPKVTESELDKLKKKTIRRNAPPGEDLKGIKAILRSIKGQNISVQEFIALIAPSTGDAGATLRSVMNDDLVAFKKLARKVYDTITQDNSDVLLNQQLQLSDYYKEKKNLLNTKMMNMIEEIYSLAPNFDFDRYANEKDYLEEIMPIPAELSMEPEEIETMKRQAAYHRLQWLRSEGERLNEENNSLKKRLNQMRRMHMEEQRKMADMERMAEAKKEALEATQAEKRETLEYLNESLEKSIIVQERSLRVTEDSEALKPGPSKQKIVKGKKSKTGMKRIRRPKWNEEAAVDIESQVLEKSHQSEKAKLSPFHYSPIKTPPRKTAAPKELSPFHYSPPKSPQGAHYVSPVQQQAARPPPPPQQPVNRGRRVQAPRDSWGGFY